MLKLVNDTPATRQAEDTFMAAVSDMPDNFLQCRDLKHRWDVVRDYHLVDASKDADIEPRLGYAVYIRRLLRCPRCGKKRSDAFVLSDDRRFQVLEKLNSTYTDSDGYLVKGVGRRISGTADLVRGEMYRRTTDNLKLAK